MSAGSATRLDPAEITFVLQGALGVGWDVRYTADHLRKVFRGCSVVLSTQKAGSASFEGGDAFDRVVLGPDPGALPPVKLGPGAPHNVNRQIASSRAGLQGVTTRYAVKMRTDCYILSTRLIDYWSALGEAGERPRARGKGRILSVSIFSVNPHYDERLSYHVSDWFQVGLTEDLQRYWQCPDYDLELASWYEGRDHASGSLRREREFRSRYATEQWLTLNYLYDPRAFPIAFHNDTSREIVSRFEEDLVDNFIIVHPSDLDLRMPKHESFYRNRYFSALCYDFGDWSRLAAEKRGLETDLTGFSLWPRTMAHTRFYIEARNRLRFLRNAPIGPLRRVLS